MLLSKTQRLLLDFWVRCMEYTGADGVLSAVSLLQNPSLFSHELGAISQRKEEDDEYHLRKVSLFMEYLQLVQDYPIKLGFVRVRKLRDLEWSFAPRHIYLGCLVNGWRSLWIFEKK